MQDGIDMRRSTWENPEGFERHPRPEIPPQQIPAVCGDENEDGWACEVPEGRPHNQHYADNGDPGGVKWPVAESDFSRPPETAGDRMTAIIEAGGTVHLGVGDDPTRSPLDRRVAPLRPLADGGIVKNPNRPYLVGERDPEWISAEEIEEARRALARAQDLPAPQLLDPMRIVSIGTSRQITEIRDIANAALESSSASAWAIALGKIADLCKPE